MEKSELIFKIVAYTLLIIFAAMCLYPLWYALCCMFSSTDALANGDVYLWPVDFDVKNLVTVATTNEFWVYYANTLFVTFIGTIWSLVYSILGAYALSKKRLLGRHGWNFFLVFTMWFSAGVIPTFLNYKTTGNIMATIATFGASSAMGSIDMKWLIVIAMGMNATNIILLRNSFEGVPSEIEEAARIDGATELQILTKVYIPMSKATIATVALFFGISRWNGYFWAYKVLQDEPYSWPVQVYIRDYIGKFTEISRGPDAKPDVEAIENWSASHDYAATSAVYSMVVCAVIPILAIYPFIQKYFAKGVNMGGVKE